MRFGGKVKRQNTVPLGTIPRRRLSDPSDPTLRVSTNGLDAPPAQSTFRRNQTLIDRTIDRYEQKTVASERLAAHSLRQRRKRILIALLSIIASVVFIWLLLLQSAFVVRVAFYGQLADISTSQQAEYSDAIGQYYLNHPLERIRTLTSLGKMASYLAINGHNEIQSVTSIEQTSLGGVQITLKAREPIASWTVSGKVSYVDKTGVVFARNFYATPPISIVDQTKSASVNAQGITASSRLLQFIGVVTGNLKGYGLGIKRIVLPQNTTREVDFVLDNNITLKMTVDRPAGEQSEDAERAVAYFRKHHIKVRYVDIRVSRQAYYK